MRRWAFNWLFPIWSTSALPSCLDFNMARLLATSCKSDVSDQLKAALLDAEAPSNCYVVIMTNEAIHIHFVMNALGSPITAEQRVPFDTKSCLMFRIDRALIGEHMFTRRQGAFSETTSLVLHPSYPMLLIHEALPDTSQEGYERYGENLVSSTHSGHIVHIPRNVWGSLASAITSHKMRCIKLWVRIKERSSGWSLARIRKTVLFADYHKGHSYHIWSVIQS